MTHATNPSPVTIDFYGATLIAQQGETPAQTLVAMKPIVEGMGLAWSPQRTKLVEHPVLSKGVTEFVIPSAGGPQAMTALPLNRLNFWLATIQPNKVPDEATRDRIIRYQIECADALFERFFGKVIGPSSTPHTAGAAINEIVAGVVSRLEAQFEAREAQLLNIIENLSTSATPVPFQTTFAGFSSGEMKPGMGLMLLEDAVVQFDTGAIAQLKDGDSGLVVHGWDKDRPMPFVAAVRRYSTDSRWETSITRLEDKEATARLPRGHSRASPHRILGAVLDVRPYGNKPADPEPGRLESPARARKSRARLSEDVVAKARHLLAEGRKDREVAETVGISRTSVANIRIGRWPAQRGQPR